MKDIRIPLIGDELRKKLIEKGIDPLKVINIITKNDKYKNLLITKIICVDGSEYELIDDFIIYAARKNKRW